MVTHRIAPAPGSNRIVAQPVGRPGPPGPPGEDASGLAAHMASTVDVHGIGDVSTLLRSPQDLHTPTPTGPTVAKDAANPIITSADSTFSTVYWPWVIRVDELLDSPLDTYYLYTSTDHDPGVGGIELWTSAAITGPYTSQGQVYVDVVADQTETPSVMWDEVEQHFKMLYQAQLTTDSTCLATSPDGVNWTRVGPVIQITHAAAGEWPGVGHSGYPRPFRIGRWWACYHLASGGGFGRQAISYSIDGVAWTTDARPLLSAADLVPAGKAIAWHQGNIVRWNQGVWWVGMVTDFSAGGPPDPSLEKFIGYAAVAPDFRHLLGPVTPIITATDAWEDGDFRTCHAVVDDGVLYVFYISAGKVGVATVGGAW